MCSKANQFYSAMNDSDGEFWSLPVFYLDDSSQHWPSLCTLSTLCAWSCAVQRHPCLASVTKWCLTSYTVGLCAFWMSDCCLNSDPITVIFWSYELKFVILKYIKSISGYIIWNWILYVIYKHVGHSFEVFLLFKVCLIFYFYNIIWLKNQSVMLYVFPEKQ